MLCHARAYMFAAGLGWAAALMLSCCALPEVTCLAAQAWALTSQVRSSLDELLATCAHTDRMHRLTCHGVSKLYQLHGRMHASCRLP